MMHLFQLLVIAVSLVVSTRALATGIKNGGRPFVSSSQQRPKLILLGGPTGTGKSTLGMSIALDQGILKCISTNTVRAVMRSFVPPEISPALHRPSYEPSGNSDKEDDDPVTSWKEACAVLSASVQGLVDDSIERGESLVLEGVHLVPSTDLIQRWQEAGGVALGCLLTIRDSPGHVQQLRRRGFMTGKEDFELKKIQSFDRIRVVQDEMIRLAQESNWLLVEQRLEPDPLDLVSEKLWEPRSCENVDTSTTTETAEQ